jgi:hypothetical protein
MRGGAGLITTLIKANHPQFGALWGEYYTLKDNPARRANLLGSLVPSAEVWAQLVQGWVPGTPAEG